MKQTKPDAAYELFEDFSKLPPNIYESLLSQGIETPTEIQKIAINPALDGQDILAQSQTGSGKTLAFALPVGLKLVGPEPHGLPRTLVLAPTRELAAQVESVFSGLLSSLGLRCLTIIGGDSYAKQKRALKKGVDIVVGTPGRIVDLMQQKNLRLEHVECFVLDEVDQMLDFGFADALAEINNALPDDIQTLFFSATMNKKMQDLARGLLENPIEIQIAPKLTSPKNIEHGYFPVRRGQELNALVNILLHEAPPQAIVFCETRKDCREVSEAIEERGFNVAALNGDLSQEVRMATLDRFRKGSLQYLIATNVAARGIDIQGLAMVINLDVPYDVESYTHRTGRTGRAGDHGKAWSIVTPRNIRRYWFQMRDLKLEPKRLKIPSQFDILAKVTEHEVNKLRKTTESPRAIRRMIDRVLEEISEEEAHDLLREHLRRKLETTDAFNANEIEDHSLEFTPDRPRNHSPRKGRRPFNKGGRGQGRPHRNAGPGKRTGKKSSSSSFGKKRNRSQAPKVKRSKQGS